MLQEIMGYKVRFYSSVLPDLEKKKKQANKNKPTIQTPDLGNKAHTKILPPAPAYFINSINWTVLRAKSRQQAQRHVINFAYNKWKWQHQVRTLRSSLLNIKCDDSVNGGLAQNKSLVTVNSTLV